MRLIGAGFPDSGLARKRCLVFRLETVFRKEIFDKFVLLCRQVFGLKLGETPLRQMRHERLQKRCLGFPPDNTARHEEGVESRDLCIIQMENGQADDPAVAENIGKGEMSHQPVPGLDDR